ncbi:MAG: hypothetical protein WD016_02200 [Balneolaceae bacterium]
MKILCYSFILLGLISCRQPTANDFSRSNTNDPENPEFQLPPISELNFSFTENKEVVIAWTDTSGFPTYYEISKAITEDDDFVVIDSVNSNQKSYTDTSEEITRNTLYQVRALRQLADTTISAEPVSRKVGFTGYTLSTTLVSISDDSVALKIEWRFNDHWPFIILIKDVDNTFSNTLNAGATNYQTPTFPHSFKERYFKFFIYLNDVQDADLIDDGFIEHLPAEGQWPSDLNAEIIDEESVQLSWTDNSNMEDDYKIFRSYNDDNNFQEIASLDSNSVSFLDDNNPFVLPPAFFNDYNFKTYYQVRAYKGDSYTGNATEVEFTISRPEFNNYTSDENEITLYWEPPKDQDNNISPFINKVFIERSINSETFDTIAELGSGATFFTDNIPVSSDLLRYRIKTVSQITSNTLLFHSAPKLQTYDFIEFPGFGFENKKSIRFSENDNYLVAANGFYNEAGNEEVIVYDINSKSIIYRFNPFNASVVGVDIHEGTNRIAAVSKTARSVKVYNFIEDTVVFQATGVDVFDIVLSPDGRYIYTNSSNGNMIKFDLESGTQIFRTNLSSITSTIRGMAISPSGDSIAYSFDGYFKLISSNGNLINFPSVDLGSTSQSTTFSGNGKYLATVRNFKTAQIQDTQNGDVLSQFSGQYIALSDDQAIYYSASYFSPEYLKFFLHFWDLRTKTTLFSEPISEINGLSYANFHSLFAVGTTQGIYLKTFSDEEMWKLKIR